MVLLSGTSRLVSGDVKGNFQQLFSRVTSIQKKSGQFDLLICVGDFFDEEVEEWTAYIEGKCKVPIPTLILGPNKVEHVKYYGIQDGCELTDNVTYLGKKGIFTGNTGLKIAYLSGVESPNGVSDDIHFSGSEVLSLTKLLDEDSKGVDILVTSQWPKGVTNYGSTLDDADTEVCGSETISQLCLRLHPRYHFCSLSGIHYERQPYRNHQILAEKERHVTRFIALAKYGAPKKKKFLYAFSITPMCLVEQKELTQQPQDVTECPYKFTPLTSVLTLQEEQTGPQFFYDLNQDIEDSNRRKRKGDSDGRSFSKKRSQTTGPCWFCLGNAEVEKQLVVSVGNHTYLALPKGGLISEHSLILTIGHTQSTVMLLQEEHREIEEYPLTLRECFKKQKKAVVFFERNYRTQHLQIQAVPVPNDCVMEMKEIFIQCAQENDFELHEIPQLSDIKQIVPPGVPYFYVELPSGDKLLHRISKNFPLQFG
ncbi:hypothetical protein ScPMuIL_015968, partial [Solemya velum]